MDEIHVFLMFRVQRVQRIEIMLTNKVENALIGKCLKAMAKL